jgi:hypothetical protein
MEQVHAMTVRDHKHYQIDNVIRNGDARDVQALRNDSVGHRDVRKIQMVIGHRIADAPVRREKVMHIAKCGTGKLRFGGVFERFVCIRENECIQRMHQGIRCHKEKYPLHIIFDGRRQFVQLAVRQPFVRGAIKLKIGYRIHCFIFLIKKMPQINNNGMGIVLPLTNSCECLFYLG